YLPGRRDVVDPRSRAAPLRRGRRAAGRFPGRSAGRESGAPRRERAAPAVGLSSALAELAPRRPRLAEDRRAPARLPGRRAGGAAVRRARPPGAAQGLSSAGPLADRRGQPPDEPTGPRGGGARLQALSDLPARARGAESGDVGWLLAK